MAAVGANRFSVSVVVHGAAGDQPLQPMYGIAENLRSYDQGYGERLDRCRAQLVTNPATAAAAWAFLKELHRYGKTYLTNSLGRSNAIAFSIALRKILDDRTGGQTRLPASDEEVPRIELSFPPDLPFHLGVMPLADLPALEGADVESAAALFPCFRAMITRRLLPIGEASRIDVSTSVIATGPEALDSVPDRGLISQGDRIHADEDGKLHALLLWYPGEPGAFSALSYFAEEDPDHWELDGPLPRKDDDRDAEAVAEDVADTLKKLPQFQSSAGPRVPYQVVHVACHGVGLAESGNPLILGRNRKRQLSWPEQFRRVTTGEAPADEIERILVTDEHLTPDLAASTDQTNGAIVMLSVCHALSRVHYPWNFAETFLRLNVRAVIGSEANCPQETTHVFATHVYRQLLAGCPLRNSVYWSQRALLARGDPLGVLFGVYGSGDLRLEPAS